MTDAANDDTIRIVRAAMAPPPRQRGPWGRRLLLLGGAGLLVAGAVGAAVWATSEAPEPPQRLGPRRLVPPLLRTTLRGESLVFAMARRSEQDATDPPGTMALRERIELLAFTVADLAPRFTVHLASVRLGDARDAGLIAEQGATIWLWLGGLGAVSAVDGQVLADTAGIAELNPELAEAIAATTRSGWRLADALVFEGGLPRRTWRLDPRDFAASPANLPPPRPLPQLNAGAAHGQGGPTAFRAAEAQLGTVWMALPAAEAKLIAPLRPGAQGRFLPEAALPAGGAQLLWRGTLRAPAPPPVTLPPMFLNRLNRPDQVTDLTVERLPGLAMAGFLTTGTEAPVELADPPGLLVLGGAAGEPLALMRLGADGRPGWRATLPITRLRSVLPGPGSLLLDGWASADPDAEDLFVAVATGDGAVRSSPFSA